MRLKLSFLALVALMSLAAPVGAQQDSSKTQDHSQDIAAIKAASKTFIKSYLDANAKAMAAHWTVNGEYYCDDGTILRGRDAIEKSYAELFAKKRPHTEADLEIESIRFPSRDTAIEEGHVKVRSGKDQATSNKYSVLHVREDGKWMMAVVREWPSEGVTLRDLDWLIGTWEAKRDDTTVRTTYEWWGNKSFIRCTITIKKNNETREGFQMIGKHHGNGGLQSWTFDSQGSFGEAAWTRDGKKWMQETTGVLEDGSIISATNILTPIDQDTFTFQSVERTVSGEAADELPPVRVVRVKSK